MRNSLSLLANSPKASSCLVVLLLFMHYNLVDEEQSDRVAVGLWTDISIRILALPNLEQITKVKLGGGNFSYALVDLSISFVSYYSSVFVYRINVSCKLNLCCRLQVNYAVIDFAQINGQDPTHVLRKYRSQIAIYTRVPLLSPARE